MAIKTNIVEYYNDLASTYDENRFGNTYGQHLHKQEKQFLEKHLDKKQTLNLCCGTGRFMEYANDGLDASNKMIAVAKTKFPSKSFYVSDAEKTSFDSSFFDNIFCLHLLMHLPKEKGLNIINESHRILKNGGKLILDFPSQKRRSLLNKNYEGWHGASSYSISELKKLTDKDWELKLYEGLLFIPIHQIPKWCRKIFLNIDSLLCKTILKEYASYIIVVLVKK